MAFSRSCPRFLFLILLALSSYAIAQEARDERIQFSPGKSAATVTSSITGYESVNYRLSAKAGQKMLVELDTDHGATYFNIFAPGKGPGEAAMYIGSTSGSRFSGELPTSGTYTIQVYMMRSAARRDEKSDYKLRVEIESDRQGKARPASSGGKLALAFEIQQSFPY